MMETSVCQGEMGVFPPDKVVPREARARPGSCLLKRLPERKRSIQGKYKRIPLSATSAIVRSNDQKKNKKQGTAYLRRRLVGAWMNHGAHGAH